MLSSPSADLAARWSRLRGEKPALRIRDAAATLGVSEAELVVLGVGQTATALAADWRALLADMPSVGRVMCLTRNEHCVHERHGRFEDVQVSGPHGLVLGPDIDLRLFLGSWRHGFAVREPFKRGERASLQFFDTSGEAAIFLHLDFRDPGEKSMKAYGKLHVELYQGAPPALGAGAPSQPVTRSWDADLTDPVVEPDGGLRLWPVEGEIQVDGAVHQLRGVLRRLGPVHER